MKISSHLHSQNIHTEITEIASIWIIFQLYFRLVVSRRPTSFTLTSVSKNNNNEKQRKEASLPPWWLDLRRSSRAEAPASRETMLERSRRAATTSPPPEIWRRLTMRRRFSGKLDKNPLLPQPVHPAAVWWGIEENQLLCNQTTEQLFLLRLFKNRPPHFHSKNVGFFL